MSTPLSEALRDVELQPGDTYRCEIGGYTVEVRVLPGSPNTENDLPGIPESDVMLDAWLELPDLRRRASGFSRLGPPIVPDVPLIPHDEDAP